MDSRANRMCADNVPFATFVMAPTPRSSTRETYVARFRCVRGVCNWTGRMWTHHVDRQRSLETFERHEWHCAEINRRVGRLLWIRVGDAGVFVERRARVLWRSNVIGSVCVSNNCNTWSEERFAETLLYLRFQMCVYAAWNPCNFVSFYSLEGGPTTAKPTRGERWIEAWNGKANL